MASERIFLDNFPVNFSEEESCVVCDDREFCQLAQWDDRVSFVYKAAASDVAIVNGDFVGSLTGWTTSGAGWSWVSGAARLTASADILYQGLTGVSAASIHKITFTISNYSSTSGYGLNVTFGSDDWLLQVPNGAQANGTYEIYLTPSSSTPDLSFFSLHGGATLDLDSVKVEELEAAAPVMTYDTSVNSLVGIPIASGVSIGAYVFTTFLWSDFLLGGGAGCYKLALLFGALPEIIYSKCYKLSETHQNTKLLSWSNNSINGYGYPYYLFRNYSYVANYLRVECSLRNPLYAGESDKYNDSVGGDSMYYSTSRKTKDLIIAEAPEYVHDSIAIGLKHKEFYIDSIRYFTEDTDYSPQGSGSVDLILREAKVSVIKSEQDLKQID